MALRFANIHFAQSRGKLLQVDTVELSSPIRHITLCRTLGTELILTVLKAELKKMDCKKLDCKKLDSEWMGRATFVD